MKLSVKLKYQLFIALLGVDVSRNLRNLHAGYLHNFPIPVLAYPLTGQDYLECRF